MLNPLIQDFRTHPLVPGCLLAAIIGDPQSRKLQSFGQPALAGFNKQKTVEILGHFQNTLVMDEAQAAKVLEIDTQFTRAFKELAKLVPEVARVTGCHAECVERLARALFGARLMAEYLEILTPPQLSYEKTAHGTTDLLAELFDTFRRLVGGAWSAFFPNDEYGLVADAAANFWVACLYSNRPDEITRGFVGYFRDQHRDRFHVLDRGPRATTTLHIKDVITEYLEKSREKLEKLHEAVEPHVRRGLDRVFSDLVRIVNRLRLPALVLLYYEFLTGKSARPSPAWTATSPRATTALRNTSCARSPRCATSIGVPSPPTRLSPSRSAWMKCSRNWTNSSASSR
jgi:hypothetical protein